MKVLVTLNILAGTEALRRRHPLERKFVTGSECLQESPINIQNGNLHCDQKICTVSTHKYTTGWLIYNNLLRLNAMTDSMFTVERRK